MTFFRLFLTGIVLLFPWNGIASAKEGLFRVVKVGKALDPDDITREPVTRYSINAGKNREVKAGDLFKIYRLVEERSMVIPGDSRKKRDSRSGRKKNGTTEYLLYVGEVQILESYKEVSLAQLYQIADPSLFPVAQYHTVMLGDYAEPFAPVEEKKPVEAKKEGLPVSAKTPPPPPVEEKVVKKVVVETDSILFDLNETKILPEARDKLKGIADEIRTFSGNIQIEGHTCDLGSDTLNLALSQKRAKAVMDYLVSEEKIAADRLSAKGMGEKFLLSPDKKEEDRKLNRRVEFKFLEK